jgi:starch phosphorylase
VASLSTIPTLPVTTLRLPAQLHGLQRMAYDLYWAWHPDTRALFSRIDRTAWRRFRSPVAVLQARTDWSELLDDNDFMVQYRRHLAAYDEYRDNGKGSWFARHHADELDGPVAYFCAEFGLHESLGIYSGGLGVLAGDHCKAASDMALPFVAVGLFYRHGYFRQTIDGDGHQEHAYPDLDVSHLPIQRVADKHGDPLVVPVELPDRTVQVAVWMVNT